MLALRKAIAPVARLQLASASSVRRMPVRNRGFFHTPDPTEEDREFIAQNVARNPVFVFSKTSCGFCDRVKELFDHYEYPYGVVELNEIDNGGRVQEALRQETGQTTVPNIFINGANIGGADKTLQLARSGDLAAMVEEALKNAEATSQAKKQSMSASLF